MKIFKTLKISYIACVVMFFLLACEEEKFEQATVTFYPTLAMELTEPLPGATAQLFTVGIKTSRVLQQESSINIRIEGNGAGYGYSYVTNPPMLTPGVVTVTIPAGENGGFFTFTPMYDGIFAPYEYDYTFKVEEMNNAIKSVGQGELKMKVLDSTVPFYTNVFDECGTVTEHIVEGENILQGPIWKCDQFPTENPTRKYLEGNAYEGEGAGSSNSYLMFPAISGAEYELVFIKFDVQSYYTGSGKMVVKYSTNYSGTGNPEAEGVTWTELTSINENLPAVGSRKWTEVSALIENTTGQDLYIALQHIGGINGNSSNWEIDNVEIKGN